MHTVHILSNTSLCWPMANTLESLAVRFTWARVLVRCLLQLLGHGHCTRTLLCQSRGSDTDFTGGAAAWEQAAMMLASAGSEGGLGIDVLPRSICEAWLTHVFSHFRFAI